MSYLTNLSSPANIMLGCLGSVACSTLILENLWLFNRIDNTLIETLWYYNLLDAALVEHCQRKVKPTSHSYYTFNQRYLNVLQKPQVAIYVKKFGN